MEKNKEYYAFISYKREDEKLAKWLQYKLEHYRFPTNLNGRTNLPKNIRPTFRDVTDLNPGLLAEEINNALCNSEWLIVICSPRSAKSPWVCKEAQTFIDLGRADHIIPFVIEGNPLSKDAATECYPEALLNLTGNNELLAANINEIGRDAAVVKVVARMFGLKFDTLWQRFEREKKKYQRIKFSLLTGIIIIMSIFLIIIQTLYNDTKKEYGRALANNILLEYAEIGKYKAMDSLLNLIETVPYTAEIEKSIRYILESGCEVPLAIINTGGNVNSIRFNPKENKFLAGGLDGYLRYIDATNGQIVWKEYINAEIGDICFIDNNRAYYSHGSSISKLDINEGKFIDSPNFRKFDISSKGYGYITDIDCTSSKYGDLILVGTSEGDVILKNGKYNFESRIENGYKTYVAIHPSLNTIVYASKGILYCYDIFSNKMQWTTSTNHYNNTVIRFDKLGNNIYIGHYYGEISIINYKTGAKINEITISSNSRSCSIEDIMISKNNDYLYCCAEDTYTYRYDLKHKNWDMRWGGHSDFIYSLDISPESSFIANGSADDKICIYPIPTIANKKDSIKLFNSNITQLEWDYDKKNLILASHDGEIAKFSPTSKTYEIKKYYLML